MATSTQNQRDGLQIVSPLGNASLRPKLVIAEQLRQTEPFDLILISTKAYSLEAAMEDFAPAVGANTRLLPMLNGLRHLDTLDARFGRERVLGGSCRIIADLGEAGRIIQDSTLGELAYGERGSAGTLASGRLEEIHRELNVPGFDATLCPDILAFMWQKWWFLSSIGALCVLARGTVGQAATAHGGADTAHAIIDECIGIAAANGYPADPAMLTAHRARLTDCGSSLTSSMYRDMLKGAPVEADPILGDMLARRHDVGAPLLTAAYMQLCVYQASRTPTK